MAKPASAELKYSLKEPGERKVEKERKRKIAIFTLLFLKFLGTYRDPQGSWPPQSPKGKL